MATSTFLSLEQFTFIAVPPDSQISSLRVSIYADGRLILNGKLAEVLSGKAVEIRFTDDARHLCFFESDSENAVRFPKNGSKRFPSAVEHLKKHKISLPARYEVKFSEDLAFWQGGLQRKPSCNQVKEPSKFEAEIEALPYVIRTFVRSLLSDETNEDAFHDIVLCCYEAMDETGHFSRAKTLSRTQLILSWTNNGRSYIIIKLYAQKPGRHGMKQFLKKWLSPIIIVVTLAAVLIIGMVNGILPEALRAVCSADPWCMLMCVVCYLGCLLCNAQGVRSFLQREGYELKIGHSLSAILTGIYYSNITPGATGGQPMQILHLTKYGIPVALGTSATAAFFIAWHLMRVVLVTVLGIIYRDCIMFNLGQYWPFLLVGYLYNILMLTLWMLFSFTRRPVQLLIRLIAKISDRLHLIRNPEKTIERLERTAERFHTSMQHLRSHRGEIARQLVLGGAAMIFTPSILYFAIRGVGLQGGTYGEIITIGLCQYISAAYMPTPGGSGAQEGLFQLYFGKMMSGASMLAVMLIWRFMSYYLGLIMGAVANLIGRRQREKLMKGKAGEDHHA